MFGNGKGLFGGGAMAAKGVQAPAPRRGGIGGFLQRNQNTLAMAGDIISRAGGGSGNPVLAQLQQQQLMDYRTQAQKQQQDAQQQQWLAQQEYARANPEPRAPDAFDIALQRGGIDPNSQQGQQMYRDRAASMARDPNDQFVTVTIPGVGTYAGPQSGLPSFAGTTPQVPVGRLTPLNAPSGAVPPPPSFAPTSITRQEYNSLVSESSQSAVDAYLARRGIRVGGN